MSTHGAVMASLLGEIKRRKVFQVAAAYAVVAWLLVQVITAIEAPLSLPDWFDTVVIVALAIGFPIAVIVAWAFDVTPEGIVRDRGEGGTATTGSRRLEVALFGLLLVAAGWIVFREINPAGSGLERLPNSVAVLPCANLSPDPDNDYFAASIHDEMLNRLAKIRALNVIARTSVLQYADVARPITEIAAELNVGSIMECSVSYAEDRIAVTAQLINADTGTHLWSDRYNREFVDVFDIQADVAEQVASALEAELLPDELESIETARTDNPEAYQLYLQALNLPSVAVNPHLLSTHLALLDQAIALDPDFAWAHAQKAMRLVRDTDLDDYAEARESVRQALDIDPTVGLAWAAIAHLDRKLLNAQPAREAYERAYALSPNDPEVLIEFSRFLSYVGEHERAIELGGQSMRVDPARNATRFADVLARAGDLDAAVDVLERAIELEPGSAPAYGELALTRLLSGDHEAALESVRRADELWPAAPGWGLSSMAEIYGRLGRIDDVNRLAARFPRDGEIEHRVRIALALHDRETALRLLREIVALQGTGSMAFDPSQIVDFKTNWESDPILDEPEFVELRSQLRFGDG
jgi:TolB-like protein/Tfp pilus assembly protein PilF